jgi:hypothetical protein
MIDHNGRDPVLSASLQGEGIVHVAYNHAYLRIEAAVFDMVYDRLKIGTTA